MNWIIPGELLALSSPSTQDRDPGAKPSTYVPFFMYNKVRALVRLNEKLYDHRHFEENGVRVFDMEYPDGSNP